MEKEKEDEQTGVEYIVLVVLSSFRHPKTAYKS